MSPITARPGSGSSAVTIQRDGTISLYSSLCQRLNYQPGDLVALDYITKGPLTILLRKDASAEHAFRLSYLTRTETGETGGKLRSKPFYDEILRHDVDWRKIGAEVEVST
jgi:hypothetical protein